MKLFSNLQAIRAAVRNLALPVIFAATIANAGDTTWNGGGGSNVWGDSNNWGGTNVFTNYGTVIFNTGGAQGTTSVINGNLSQNGLRWTGSSSWTLNNSSGSVLSLFDNGGTQAKIENQSTGLVTINAPITFAANNGAPPNPFGEINAVNGDITFGTGTLTVSGSSVNGVKLFGSNHTTTFNNTVSSSGKWFGLTGATTTMAVGGAFTSGDIYVMNGGTLKLNSGGTVTTSALRLGGDFGNTGNQNQTLGGTLQFTSLTGGQSFASIINTVTGNTSNALLIDSLNTSGTNTLAGASFLDADLKTQVASGGTLSFTGGSIDAKNRKLTVAGAGTTVINEPLTSSLGAGGFLVKEGGGTLILQGTSNTYTGTSNATLNANGTQIAGGTLGIHGDASLGLAPAGAYNNIQFTASGTLQDTANNISLNANRNVSVASAATATFDNNGNTFTINGVVNGSGGNVSSSGAGITIFAGNNTYTGTTAVTQGTLQLNHASGLGTTAGGASVSNGATLKLNTGVNIGAEALSINGAGAGGVGALQGSGFTNSYAGQITAATNATISANGGTLTLTGGLVKDGTTLTLYGGPSGGAFDINTTGISGASASSDLVVDNASVNLNTTSSYNGPTYIRNAGTLNTNVAGALPAATRTALILDDTGGGNSTLGVNASNSIASLSGASTSFVGLTGSSVLTVGTGSGSTNFAGSILGLGSVVKDGASTQVLSGSGSSYSGATTVSQGTLGVTANNALGTNAAGTTVASGAALKLTSVNYTTAEALTINGTGPGGTGALSNIGTSTFAGQVTAATNATINAGGGLGNLTFTGGLVKNGTTLTIAGGGIVNVNTAGISGSLSNSDLVVDNTTLVLNAASTYNGPTTVQGANGVLKLGNSNVLPTAPHTAVSVITGAKLDLNGKSDTVASLSGTGTVTSSAAGPSTLTVGGSNGSGDFEGVIQDGNGSVSLQKTGSGTQTISGANTYTGTTVVINGTLQVGFSSAGQTGTGVTTVQSAATIAGTGTILGNATVNGVIRPGDSFGADFGILNFGGDLTLTGTSTSYFQIGDPSSLYDQVRNTTGTSFLTLAGIIDAGSAFGGGYTPVDGDLWVLFDAWGSIDATGFNMGTNLLLPDVSSFGLVWDKSNFTTNGSLTLTTAPEPSRAMLVLGGALLGLARRRRARFADC